MSDMNDVWSVGICTSFSLSFKFLILNKCGKKTDRELAKPGSFSPAAKMEPMAPLLLAVTVQTV